MLDLLKENNRLKMTLTLGIMSLTCFFMWVFRANLSGHVTYIFLNWNLFLAFLPWMATSALSLHPSLQKSRLALFCTISFWLLFFPNALYILTDLFHLHKGTTMPMWFDLVMVIMFAWTGLLFGFISLFDIEHILTSKIKKHLIPVISVLLLFAGSFGVYLGRYLRWNSWDILQDPIPLFYDISDRLIHPFSHPRTWGVTLFMGLLLTMMYFSFKLLRDKRQS